MKNPKKITCAGIRHFNKALKGVESASIRAWASTEHNLPIWREIATTAVRNGKGTPEGVASLTAYIVCVAIGA